MRIRLYQVLERHPSLAFANEFAAFFSFRRKYSFLLARNESREILCCGVMERVMDGY